MAKLADVRFYFDADVLGLAKIVCTLRWDSTYPGDPGGEVHKRFRPPCPVASTSAPDTVWIPAVAAQGWLIVTRDSQIQNHLAEMNAVRESRAKMIALSGREAQGTWNALEIFMSQWRHIEALSERSGPFIFRASRSRLSQVDL